MEWKQGKLFRFQINIQYLVSTDGYHLRYMLSN